MIAAFDAARPSQTFAPGSLVKGSQSIVKQVERSERQKEAFGQGYSFIQRPIISMRPVKRRDTAL